MIGSNQSSAPNTQRKIIININKSNRKSKSDLQQSSTMSLFNPNKQLPKLLEISQRCFDYYEKFKEDRLQEEQYTEIMFNQLLNHLNDIFKELYSTISTKEKELKKCIMEKKKEFLTFHPLHFLSLTSKIQAIREQKVFYEKLNFPLNSDKIFETKYGTNGQLKQNDISQFAKLLNQFYTQIQSIEKVSYKENVKETIEKIKSLIEEQSSNFTCQHNIQLDQHLFSDPNRHGDSNQDLFEIKQFEDDYQVFAWEEFKANTERSQRDIDYNLQKYAKVMSVF